MGDPTFIACPHCGEPVVMTAMQQELFRGRTLACARCAKPFTVDAQKTPLYSLSTAGRAHFATQREGAPPSVNEGPASPTSNPTDTAVSPAATNTPQPKAAPRESQGRWKIPLLVTACILVFIGGLAAMILPSVRETRSLQHRVACASNLRQIGVALQVYATGNGGAYPPSISELLSGGLITPKELVCPDSSDTPVTGATGAIQAANLALGQHMSYVYVGAGLTTAAAANPKAVLAYEPLTNHGSNVGINVLFANGSVQFLAPVNARALIASQGTAVAPPSATQPVESQ